MNSNTYRHPKKARPQFLNVLAPKVFPLIASKGKAKKAIVQGQLLLNGKKAREDARVMPGDEITLLERQQKTAKRSDEKVFEQKLEVIFEDEHLAIINKPGGLAVNGNKFKTVENALPYNVKSSKEKDALNKMRPLHRLDEPTAGLVVVAKTERAQVLMGRQFQAKTIRKRYKAVVIGRVKDRKGKITKSVDGKKSISEFELVGQSYSVEYPGLSLMDLYPVTGRTHQLRIHMESLGHPIVGDRYYPGKFKVVTEKGLLLCSDKLWFTHPITGKEMEVEIDIPNKFKKFMEREEVRYKRSKNKR